MTFIENIELVLFMVLSHENCSHYQELSYCFTSPSIIKIGCVKISCHKIITSQAIYLSSISQLDSYIDT